MEKIRLLLIVSIMSLCAAGSAVAQWVPITPTTGAYTGYMNCFVANGTTVYAGADDHSGVYVSLNDGSTWAHATNTNLSAAPVRSLVISGSNLVAGTEGAGIFYSSTNADSWTLATGIPAGAKVIALVANGANVYAGDYLSGFYASTDNGQTFSLVATTGLPNPTNATGIARLGTDMYLTTIANGVFKSTDGGTTWGAVNSAPLPLDTYTIVTKGSNLYVGTNTTPTGVYMSADNGASWTSITSAGLTNQKIWCLMVNGAYLYAGTDAGIFTTPNDGVTWTDVSGALAGGALIDVGLLINNSNIYAGTGAGFYMRAVSEALPVELTSFTASGKAGAIELQWKTATETNNYGFEVERRQASGASWSKIGFVGGAGTTNAARAYTYTDITAASGTNAYRLKQIDRDGKFAYSPVVEAAAGQAAQTFELAQNYPNPFNPMTTIAFSVPGNGRAILSVYNTIGQLVATLFDGVVETGVSKAVTFDASQLPSGVYFSRLQFNDKQTMKKIVLMK